MGAGRKTKTLPLKEKSQFPRTVNCSVTARNLRKSDLGGVIFGCKNHTINECLSNQLFGLPAPHFAYVRNIDPGLPLFLFNYSDRKLHGIFDAESPGQMNINPHGWTGDGSECTPYPAQVRVQVRMSCQPLLEDQFSPIIAKNYYETRLFWFELDRDQTNKLISLFSSAPVTVSTSLSKNLDRGSTLVKTISAPNARQGGGRNEVPASGWGVFRPNQDNREWGYFWGAPALGGESHMLKAVINDAAAEKSEEVVRMQPNFGRSYSSVVRNLSTSIAHSDQSNTEWGSCDAPGLGGDSGLLEVTIKEEAMEDCKQQELLTLKKNCDQSYSSFVSTPLPKWSALFETSDSRTEVENLKAPASEVNFPCPDQFNMEWESPHDAGCLNGESHLLEAPADVEASRKYDEELLLEPNREVLHSSVVTELSTSCGTLTIGDTSQGGKYLKAAASEANYPYSDKFNIGWGFSCGAGHSNGECQPSEVPTDEDATETHEEHPNLDRHNSFVSAMSEEMVSDDVHGEDEVCLEHVCLSKAGMVSKLKSSNLPSVVAKLLQEVEELKSSHLQQVQNFSSLEQELVESRIEIQQLKSRYKILKCQSSPALEHAEEAEFESINERYPNFDKSILIAGGFDGSSWLSSLDLYSPSQDLMKSLSPMSFVRSYASAAKLNGELFVFGGVYGDLWYDTVESYNPISNQWVVRPSLNQRKGSLAGVSLNNKIFAIGGGNGVACFSKVEMLDLDVGKWIPIQSMLHKRFAPAAAEINGMLYVVGGYNGQDYLRSVERFDPREHSWTILESMTAKRGCHSLAVLNEKLYALGGYDGSSMVPTIEVFDPRFGSWMMGESMNGSRGYSSAVVIGDAIYVIGGLKNNEEILDTVECYKENHGWQVTNLKAIGKRCFFSAVAL